MDPTLTSEHEMAAKMVRDYDIARLLCLRAGWLKNQGQREDRPLHCELPAYDPDEWQK
jgi:hypothetical protein